MSQRPSLRFPRRARGIETFLSVASGLDLPRIRDRATSAANLPEIIPSRLPECADTRSLPRIISSGAESPGQLGWPK